MKKNNRSTSTIVRGGGWLMVKNMATVKWKICILNWIFSRLATRLTPTRSSLSSVLSSFLSSFLSRPQLLFSLSVFFWFDFHNLFFYLDLFFCRHELVCVVHVFVRLLSLIVCVLISLLSCFCFELLCETLVPSSFVYWVFFLFPELWPTFAPEGKWYMLTTNK